MSVPQTLPPPAPGEPLRTTVPGTFSIDRLEVLLAGPSGTAPFVGGIFVEHVVGPASLTFDWHPQNGVFSCNPFPTQCGTTFGAWEFDSGFGRIDPTPEPVTLLLFGTTAAGLGLARWYRRRGRAREHAA